MVQIKVKRKVNYTQITHKLEKNEQINTMELDIIRKGEIRTLEAPTVESGLFGTRLKFVVSNHLDVVSYLSSGIDFGQFAELVEALIQTVHACHSFGIRVSNLEVCPNLIYYNFTLKEVKMLYWPLLSLQEYADERTLFEQLIPLYVCKREDQSFKNCYVSCFDTRARFDLIKFEKNIYSLKKNWLEQRTSGDVEFGGSVVIPDLPDEPGNRTVSLKYASLYRVSINDYIELKKLPFTIGRSIHENDYALEGNLSVGRKPHAIFDKTDAGFIVRDNDSMNGVQVNGQFIPANKDVVIHSSNSIMIGNEEFIFFAPAGK